MKRYDEIAELNKRLANEIANCERDGDYDRGIELKRELYGNKLEMLDLLETGSSDGEGVTLNEAIEMLENMPARVKYETGVPSIDRHLDGGIEEHQLLMLGGEKGAGKTAFAMQIMYNVSRGHSSVLFTYEMPAWKIALRMKKNRLSTSERNRIRIVEKGRDIDQIEKSIKGHAAKGTKFFVIDSLMKITNRRLAAKRNEQISDITSRLSRLCVEQGVIVILIVQVSKDDLKNGHMAIKGSGDADYDADIMLFFTKDKNMENKRTMICEKNRQNGIEFKEELIIDKTTVTMQPYTAMASMEVVYEDIPKDSPGRNDTIEMTIIG